MEHYTAQIIVNGEFRTMLIYKSEIPMEFETPGYHKFVEPGENSTIQRTYITGPEPYRTVTPEESDSGPYYFYWFIVDRIDTTELMIDSAELEGLKARQDELETAMQSSVTYGELAAAIREGVNSVE